jgi:SAM-dependent methyltransferase
MTNEELFTKIKLRPKTMGLYVVRTVLFKNIKEHAHLLKGHLLDLGSGTAPYKDYILGLGKVKKYTTLDFEGGYEGVHPDMYWDGTKIPLPDLSVDSILCTEVFEHCPNIEQILLEIKRILRPGGVLIFTVPFLWPLHLLPHDEYRYTPVSLNRHLNNTGFTDFDLF